MIYSPGVSDESIYLSDVGNERIYQPGGGDKRIYSTVGCDERIYLPSIGNEVNEWSTKLVKMMKASTYMGEVKNGLNFLS